MTQTTMLPSSLTRSPKVDPTMSAFGREWLYLYCASCGKDGGRVLKTDVPNKEEFAFYLCDPCGAKYGNIQGTYAVPDEVFFEKVKQAALERKLQPQDLTEQTIVILLDDPESWLSKLAKDRNTFLASE